MDIGRSLLVLAVTILLLGCNEPIGDYVAASTIAESGFAKNEDWLRSVQGQEVKVWGFVDHGNMYGDEGAGEILQEWWSGEGPSATTWRFDIKASEDDAVGQSFAVHVPNDEGRDALLERFLADARAQRPTKVFVTGTVLTYDAPVSAGRLTGLTMELRSSRDILLAHQVNEPVTSPTSSQ